MDRECVGNAPLGEGVAQVRGHTELFKSFCHVHFRIVVKMPRLPVPGLKAVFPRESNDK